MSDSLWPRGLQNARPPCPSPTPAVYLNSCPLSRWCRPTNSSSVIPFPCLQSFPASGSFQMSQFFTSGGQSIGALSSASVLPMSIQGWFLLGLTGLISLLSKGLIRLFSSNTVWRHQLFSAQPLFIVQFSYPCMTIGKTGADAEAPILWLPDAKNWLIGKDPDAGKDWRQKEKRATEFKMVR